MDEKPISGTDFLRIVQLHRPKIGALEGLKEVAQCIQIIA